MIARADRFVMHGLHFLLALTLPLALIALSGCKKAKETKEDLGPEISANAVDLALSKAIGRIDYSRLRVDQFLTYALTQRVENIETTTLIDVTSAKIITRAEEPDGITRFTVRVQRSTRRPDGDFDTIVTEEDIRIRGLSPSAALGLDRPLAVRSVGASAENPVRVTYHNLREINETLPAPVSVRDRPDCGGLAGCEIPVRFVRFDVVQWFADESYRKISVDFGFSDATPVLPFGDGFEQLSGRLIIDCRSTFIPVDGRSVYVRECRSLEDFQH